MEQNTQFSGIVINGGFGVGKAKLILKQQETNFIPKTRDAFNPSLEKEKIIQAFSYLVSQNKKTQNKIKDRISKKDFEILQSFSTILKDQIIINEIIQLVKKDKKFADQAVNEVFTKYISIFKSSPDQYFAERAEDLVVIKNKLIAKINNNLIENHLDSLNQIKEDFILVTNELDPDDISSIFSSFLKGIILFKGAASSHIAILLKNFKVPVLFSVSKLENEKNINDKIIVIDGKDGKVYLNLNDDDLNFFKNQQQKWLNFTRTIESYGHKKVKTLDGFPCFIEANIGTIADAEKARAEGAEGIGLFRTEFFFTNSNDWPDYEYQTSVYSQIAAKFKNYTVVVRTLDIGADKELSYFNFPKEYNPFLGNRGIRFSLTHPDIFKIQIKALLKASATFKNINIMLPMISTVEEIYKVKEIINAVKEDLKNEENIEHFNDKLGIMIETPASAAAARVLASHVDFFSLGTNDLIQYSIAADRTNLQLNHLYQPLHPGVLQLIHNTIYAMNQEIANGNSQKWVGMCGNSAGDPLVIPLLIGMGLQNYSVSVSSVNYVRYLISNLKKSDCEKLFQSAIKIAEESKIKKLVKDFLVQKKIIIF